MPAVTFLPQVFLAFAVIFLPGHQVVAQLLNQVKSCVVSNNGLKWVICSVRSAKRSVGYSARPLDVFSSLRRRTAWSWAHGAGRVWCWSRSGR